MATTKKTTKKTAKYRYLTDAERNKIRKQFQTFMPYLVKLRENEKIEPETRAVIRKMHKSLRDALDYSQKLNTLQ